MAVHQLAPTARKSLGESALCFGCTIAGLAAAAIALQWVAGLFG